MNLYHASPVQLLHRLGIKSNVEKSCCNFDDGYVYVGSLDYIYKQYFSYCPKGKVYYIYRAHITEDDKRLEHLENVDHYRFKGIIPPELISVFGSEFVE